MSQPLIDPTTDGYVLTWPDYPVHVYMSRLHESRDRLNAETMITYTNGTSRPAILKQQTWNLLAGRTQVQLAKELALRINEVPWESLLEQACQLTIRTFRLGEPVVSLEPCEQDAPSQFLLNPLLYVANPTVIYGPGGSMKSYFALYCGMLLASGVSANGLYHSGDSRKVLYLDYEMTAPDLRGRTKWLRAGDARLTSTPDYRRCFRPLADEVTELRKVIIEGAYEVLIVDSLSLAAGGAELEKAEAPQRFNAALRTLAVTSLLIGHTPKDRESVPEERTLYGNVFFRNLARSVWEVRKDGTVLGLFHRKNNLGPELPAFGLHLGIDNDLGLCTWDHAELSDEPELRKALSVPAQLSCLLKQQAYTTNQLLELVEGKADTIRRNLQRYKGKRWDHDKEDGDKTRWSWL
jgi:hypothetical protein